MRKRDADRTERVTGSAPPGPLPPWLLDAEIALRIAIAPELGGERLDKVVARALAQRLATPPGEAEPAATLGRATLKQLFSTGRVWLVALDGHARPAAKGESAIVGEIVVVRGSAVDLACVTDHPAVADPEAPLRVVLETMHVVAIDKPAGQPCAPLEPDERGTVASALLARYPEMAEVGFSPREPGLCHRLDNDTSGLLLAARSAAAFATLTAAIRAGRLHKRYLLLCAARGLDERGSIDLPLAPHPHDSRRVLACSHPRDRARHAAREALTHYRVLQRVGESALVEARAPKALRHQLRAHFAAIGHPIHGDRLYGSRVALELGRHALHASAITFAGEAPVEAFRLRSPLPAELRALLGGEAEEAKPEKTSS